MKKLIIILIMMSSAAYASEASDYLARSKAEGAKGNIEFACYLLELASAKAKNNSELDVYKESELFLGPNCNRLTVPE